MGTRQDTATTQSQAPAKAKTAKEAVLETSPGTAAQVQVTPPIVVAPLPPKGKTSRPGKGESEHAFLKEALVLARHLHVDHVLFISDLPPPLELLTQRGVKKTVIVATQSEKVGAQCEEQGLRYVIIPAYAFDRFEKIKVALAACVSARTVAEGARVLCLAGQTNSPSLDTCMVARIGEDSEERAALGVLDVGTEFHPQVLETVLNIALSIGYEGFEGAPVGTIFVVGDCTNVLEKSRQLTLNPFQGYSEDEKNILDPRVRDAIKNYCLLDGAFVIREDGVVLAAGRYLQASKDMEINLPLGLGARNAAAMTITKSSSALAFVISKTTGAVRIYKKGMLALEFRQPRRRFM